MKKYAIATIHKDNIKSIEFIGKCGFTRYSEDGEFHIYRRELKEFKQVVAIRADANEVVGTGHIMRCISIASKITSYGVGCVFITADNKSDAVLREYEHVALGSQYNDMDSELERLEKIISADGITALLVDSYYVTRSYLGVLKKFCKEKNIKLVYIDDVCSFPYACNTLINYNIYADEVSYRRLYAGTKAPKLCLGVSYAPLRDEFLNTGGVIKAGARDIMISTGGADTEHICLGIIKEIGKQVELSKYHFHCIIGAMNGDRDEIRALAASLKNVILYENVRNMSAIMNKCDVAISAAGSTLYELSATKTPTITYVLADNQISGAKKFEELGIMRYCGDVHRTSMTTLCRELLRSAKELIESYELRCKMAEKMATIVDGRGAGRIAYEIINAD